jgi:hypothetical protein
MRQALYVPSSVCTHSGARVLELADLHREMQRVSKKHEERPGPRPRRGWIEVARIVRPPGEVVVSMRPVSVFAKGPGCEIEQVRGDLHGRWRRATREVMVLLSLHGLPASPDRGAAGGPSHPLRRLDAGRCCGGPRPSGDA